jgi:hypothetical protein
MTDTTPMAETRTLLRRLSGHVFKAMDTNHDGTVTLEEMEAFMHGTGGASAR